MVGGLALGGAALNFVVSPERGRTAAVQAEPTGLPATAGAGALFGWLGGFRALAGDFLWLRLFAGWQDRDLPGTQTLIRAVVAVDPRPIYFWLNGARMLAYDLPAWRIQAEGGYEAVSPARRRVIEVEHAQLALRHIEEARKVQLDAAALWVEQANIELNKLDDAAAAAASYRRAWEAPGGPYYAARIYAEVLRKQGKNAEAYAWLRNLHAKLPPDDEAANAPLVLARIRELEKTLSVPSRDTYRPVK
ncbi:MAG: hypothetical protein H7343_11920 [Undibacterium sp.]|nr:hypothetical protein [Opitutaceae bacterium]